MRKVMILGAYGNFGKIISNSLARSKTPIILAGKDMQKLTHLKNQLTQKYSAQVETSQLNINKNLKKQVARFKPCVLINTVGPFQQSNYGVIQTAIQQRVHYVDLADGRSFIKNANKFDQKAKQNKLSVICGASTVPGLSSAVIQQFKSQFQSIDELVYGLSPGQKTTRGGLATIKAVLSYIGKPIKSYQNKVVYGWQDIYLQNYPELGGRLMGNCEVPDFDIFPDQYKIKKILFSAGMESKILHLNIWLASWLIRIGLPLNLVKHAQLLSNVSHWFDILGTNDGGMHIILKGKNKEGQNIERKWFIIVRNGDGPNIPTIPAIVLANKISRGQSMNYGVFPCSGLITLKEYLDQMKPYDYKVYTNKQLKK